MCVKRWTTTEVSQLRKLVKKYEKNDGYVTQNNWKKIAEQIGRSFQSVQKKWKNLNYDVIY